ncbi:hypothetical protein F2Q68_00026069 [Brassica cretica]|uniref:Neprosin activation peptide domain-containing protein n=1 Tax=Brassica cretica TaxID=69181 RepID=A0A8S9IGP9_BRACR|nr:hypothetical protein F2Q68_00026069 [Brassica cretica]
MAVCSLANKPMVGYLMVVLMVMVTMIMEPMAGKVNLSGQREQEIELRLKQLNKQALKSIESSDEEIIDCIPIAKQLAFDHPMLKNHMIQPHEVLTDEDNAPAPSNDEEQPENISQPWQMAGECPENTIPIKRITKEDLLRVDNIKNYGEKSNISRPYQLYKPTDIISDNNDHEYAIAYVNGGPYRRTKAQINVWIIGGKFGLGLNTIEAGLHVNPDLYGDANPHFFIYWTKSLPWWCV